MEAKTLARLLRARDIPIRSFAEGDDVEDGEVTISEAVHVQVPTLGDDDVMVVRIVPERGEPTFLFSNPVAVDLRAGDVDAVVDEIERCERAAILDYAKAHGLQHTETGGGCDGLCLNLKGGGYILITEAVDPQMPKFMDRPVAVGWYDVEGMNDGHTRHAPNFKAGVRMAKSRKMRGRANDEADLLDSAFNRVAGADWKGPIKAIVHPGERELMRSAVIYHTATIPTFEPHPTKRGMLLMQADGYRAGPAGDH